MNSQFRVLIPRLSSFAVAAIDLARVIQIVWLLFNQTTVNWDENGILAVLRLHSSIKMVKIVEITEFWRICHFHKLLES